MFGHVGTSRVATPQPGMYFGRPFTQPRKRAQASGNETAADPSESYMTGNLPPPVNGPSTNGGGGQPARAKTPPWPVGSFIQQSIIGEDGRTYTNPAVYQVGADGLLHWVTNPAVAEKLKGKDWPSKVRSIWFDDFEGLTIGASLR